MIGLSLLPAFLVAAETAPSKDIRVNRLGYESRGPKTAVVLQGTASTGDSFQLIDRSGQVVFTGPLGSAQTVPGWKNGPWRVADFSEFTGTGTFRLKLGAGGMESDTFGVDTCRLYSTAAPAVLDFFQGMRHTDEKDRAIGYFGEPGRGTHDVYGGWWDATGDAGKYLSHLSYANFMNPQQIPMVVWSLLRSAELAPGTSAPFAKRLRDEAAWGASYLLRVQDTQGYFYINVFDHWGADPRKISAWTGTAAAQGTMTGDYQAAWREGGGMAIAALALASRSGIRPDSSQMYLDAALRGYEHLSARRGRWADDGRENLIDHYCALLAGLELHLATGQARFLDSAAARADSILGRQRPEGWLVSDAGARPFFHGVDEGLPLVALWAYLEVDGRSERSTRIRQSLARSVAWYRGLSREVANPFLYPRMYAPIAPSSGPVGSGNVAKGKKAWATSVEGAGREPEKAVDGVDGAGSRWASAIEGTKPVDGSVQALVVDLGEKHLLSSIAVSWETARAVDFDFLGALDTSRWDTLKKYTANDALQNKWTAPDSLWVRWIKVLCLKRANQNWPFSIQELTVVGQKEIVPVTSVPARKSFFMPHRNETDYWWQGENARLGSMAAGLILAQSAVRPAGLGIDSLSREAIAPLDWVAGKNTEGINFVYGVAGGDYAAYFAGKGRNTQGGICNGITAVSDSDQTPVFNNSGASDNWRWVEQWLPHDAWFLLGSAAVAHVQEYPEGSPVRRVQPLRGAMKFRLEAGGALRAASAEAGSWTLLGTNGRILSTGDGLEFRCRPGSGLWILQHRRLDGSSESRSLLVP